MYAFKLPGFRSARGVSSPSGAETIVRVQAEWDGWRTAFVPFGAIRDIHWRQPGRAPRPLIHGSVLCGDVAAGEIPHACDPSSAPHQLRICILKRHTSAAVYAELMRLADERG